MGLISLAWNAYAKVIRSMIHLYIFMDSNAKILLMSPEEQEKLMRDIMVFMLGDTPWEEDEDDNTTT